MNKLISGGWEGEGFGREGREEGVKELERGKKKKKRKQKKGEWDRN